MSIKQSHTELLHSFAHKLLSMHGVVIFSSVTIIKQGVIIAKSFLKRTLSKFIARLSHYALVTHTETAGHTEQATMTIRL